MKEKLSSELFPSAQIKGQNTWW